MQDKWNWTFEYTYFPYFVFVAIATKAQLWMDRGCFNHTDVKTWIEDNPNEDVDEEIKVFSQYFDELNEKMGRNEVEEIADRIVRHLSFYIIIIDSFNQLNLDGMC